MVPLKDTTATAIAWHLYERIISRYGGPDHLLSHRGQNLLSKVVTEVCWMGPSPLCPRPNKPSRFLGRKATMKKYKETTWEPAGIPDEPIHDFHVRETRRRRALHR